MIHEIGRELEAALREKGCPLPIVDAPEKTGTTTFARERITIGYGRGFGFVGPKVPSRNPKQAWNLVVPGEVKIYVQSPRPGALYFEHQRRALAVARMVGTALREILVVRRNWPSLPVGDFEDAPDLAASESRGGAIFAITFTFDTGVPDLTWAGAMDPEGTITGVTSTTRARRPNESTDDAETACGG